MKNLEKPNACIDMLNRRDEILKNMRRASGDDTPLERLPQLMAVTKRQPEEKILCLLHDGHVLYGENRVQDAAARWPALKAQFPQARLHMIGALQSNKAADAIQLFDVIETLDRSSLLHALGKACDTAKRTVDCMVQVNIGREPQKSGVDPDALDDFLTECGYVERVRITGLMCIPPAQDDPMLYFQTMQQLQQRHDLPHLSMGMSGDYEAAIRCGATHIRVGTALMGERTE